ncbi:MAG: molybdopterin-guanine dinucleotide biosynthesis protein B [Gemmatimonadota bacterium]
MKATDEGRGPEALPPVVCIVGRKDSGKTTTAVRLVAELSGRGHRVMTAKHGHGFELDTPGTDSYRHRHEGGAGRVALVGPEAMAVMGRWGPAGEPPLADVVARFLADAEIVVAEGWKGGPEPKVEVHRSGRHADPIYVGGPPNAASFLAVVSDREDLALDVPVLPLGAPDLPCLLADLVERALLPGR